MGQSVKFKRSSVVTNGAPKLPTAEQLNAGELAINFAQGHETLSTKNSNNEIATFSSDSVLDKKYIASGAVVGAITSLSAVVVDNEYVIAQAFNDQDRRIETLENAGFITGYTETDPTVPSWAKQSSKPTYTASEVGAMATSERGNYLSASTTYFDDAEYDSGTKRINFKKNNTVVDYIDATDFIKDGMVSSVTVANDNLVITFNTEAGKEDITLALSQIFNPNNYYDKTAADAKFLSAYTETDPTVPSWAKQSTKPTYNASEVGALPTGTTLDNISDGSTRKLSNYSLTGHTHDNYSLTGHSHTAAEVGALPDTTPVPTQASITSSGFTKNAGTLTGVTVNNTAATVSNGNASITIPKELPTVSSSDNGKVLMVVNGQWSAATPVTIYTGNATPDNLLGNNGDIYLQTN